MNNRYLKIALLTAVCSSLPVGFTSCKDYGDDIDNLQNQIDAINVSLTKLQDLISSGCVITSVTPTSNGVAFTLSDGKTYEITNGKNGTVWEIGADGYWYKDGTKTTYKAIGADGAVGPEGPKGDQGETGAPGAPGKNGDYYVPNPKTGNFDIYNDGHFVKDSGISWRSENEGGISAVYSGNSLTLGGVKDDNGKPVSLTIPIGTPVGTIAFIPSVLSNVGGYPTTDDPFYHLNSYLSETKADAVGNFIPQTNWDKSNIVALEYRISPKDAYIPNTAHGSFLNRVVKTRAAGDMTTLLSVASFDPEAASKTGELVVNATYNKTAAATSGHDIAAFQLWNGLVPFTTDYISATSQAIDAVIVDAPTTRAGSAPVMFYTRNKAIPTAATESSAFIQGIVPLSAAANLSMAYDGSLDLAPYVDLYTVTKSAFLRDLNFQGISFEFSLPKEYLANDTQHTDQQWFVQLNGSTLSANTAHLTEGLTPAIGRTPVVRVDAFMTDNKGVKQMVASSYIKILIKDRVDNTPQKDLTYDMTKQEFEYHSLKNTQTLVGQMNWTEVNNQIYGRPGLNSSNFWEYYGGTSNEYTVSVSVNDRGTDRVIASRTATAGTPCIFTRDGITCNVTLDNSNTTTSNILFTIDNKVKTENSYGEPNKNGAEYTVTITINSDNITSRGNVVVTQKFSVREDCKKYAFRDIYYAGEDKDGHGFAQTKGKNTATGWKLEMNVSEVFVMTNGKNIYQYYNGANEDNVTGIEFNLLSPLTGVALSPLASGATDQTVSLTDPLIGTSKMANLDYVLSLVNGEKCTFYFGIQFNNPFQSGVDGGVVMDGNEIGAAKGYAAHYVKVIDFKNNTILHWNNGLSKLALTTVATNDYKLQPAMVDVKYNFKEDEAFKKFNDQLEPGVLTRDENTGEITYNNYGATLQEDVNITMLATITFKGISIVTCEIPVKIQK